MNRLLLVALTTFLSASMHTSSITAQSLLLSVNTPAASGADPDQNYDRGDILTFSSGTGTTHLASREALTVLVGDGNGNGTYDDAPDVIDALAVPDQPIANDLLGVLMSFDKTVRFADGTTVLDGDVVALQPNGGVSIVYPESLFAQVTGTSSIDVDAFHVESDGRLVFSFANDESTSLPALVQQNGGQALLDETTIFSLDAGATEATILHTRDMVVAMVNQALGTSVSTVVDAGAITADPTHPGHYIFALGSTNSAIEGRLISTWNQGSLANVGGLDLVSGSFGFVDDEVFTALAFVPSAPPTLNLYGPETFSIGMPDSLAVFRASGATPSALLKLGAAQSEFPAPASMFSSSLNPPSWIFLDIADPFLVISLQSTAFMTISDVDGRAIWTFATQFVPPGLSITLQAIEMGTLRTSLPVIVNT